MGYVHGWPCYLKDTLQKYSWSSIYDNASIRHLELRPNAADRFHHISAITTSPQTLLKRPLPLPT